MLLKTLRSPLQHHVFSKATVSQPTEKLYNFTQETAGTSVPSLWKTCRYVMSHNNAYVTDNEGGILEQ